MPFRNLYIGMVVLLAAVLVERACNSSSPPAPAPGQTQAYEVAGYRMAIPVGYISKLERAMHGPPTDKVRVDSKMNQMVDLQMEYPIMRPWPERSDALRDDRVPPKENIHVTLIVSTGINQLPRSKFMQKYLQENPCAFSKVMDLCPDYRESKITPRDAFYLGEGFDFVYCTRSSRVPRPHCEFHQMLLDDLEIRLFFDRRLLADVSMIRDRVYDLVCSWIDLSPGRSLTVDRCR